MAKKMKTIEVGSLVAFNELKDAYFFKVIAIDGFNLSLSDPAYENSAIQIMDKAFVKQVR